MLRVRCSTATAHLATIGELLFICEEPDHYASPGQIVAAVPVQLLFRVSYVWLRLATLPNTPTARVHLQRIVIEKVWLPRLRCRGLAATLLELLSLPTRPPGSQVLQLSPQPPRARKISPTRLAALPTQ
jgi:hypothetical protein